MTTITSAANAAQFTGSVAGSLATLKGSALNGTNLSVTINGLPARVLFASNDQINVQIPAGLTGATVQVIVTANGVTSTPFIAPLAAVSPGIFVPGILNQDNTVNSPTNPAKLGSIVQIYATGLLMPDGSGTVNARIHDVDYSPGSTGLPYAVRRREFPVCSR
ncbi:MAG: IPT/TIG domain-containing protein [Bryobacteraceae bacterium]